MVAALSYSAGQLSRAVCVTKQRKSGRLRFAPSLRRASARGHAHTLLPGNRAARRRCATPASCHWCVHSAKPLSLGNNHQRTFKTGPACLLAAPSHGRDTAYSSHRSQLISICAVHSMQQVQHKTAAFVHQVLQSTETCMHMPQVHLQLCADRHSGTASSWDNTWHAWGRAWATLAPMSTLPTQNRSDSRRQQWQHAWCCQHAHQVCQRQYT
jgi:hypothetical protein